MSPVRLCRMTACVQVFGRRQQGVSARSTDRRPKSAKARSRGSLAPAGQRALWGFDAGADLDGGRDAGRM